MSGWSVEQEQMVTITGYNRRSEEREIRFQKPEEVWLREKESDDGSFVTTEIEPFTRELFKIQIELQTPGCTLHKLMVGVRDKKVQWISFIYTNAGSSWKSGDHWGFVNDQPGAFVWGFGEWPTWPTNHPAVIGRDTRPYFDRLKDEIPRIAESLTKCVSLLETLGVDYKEKDSSLKFIL